MPDVVEGLQGWKEQGPGGDARTASEDGVFESLLIFITFGADSRLIGGVPWQVGCEVAIL